MHHFSIGRNHHCQPNILCKNNRWLLPGISDCMRALEVSQTCTFYDHGNGDEMRAKVNAFSKLYDTSMNKAKTQKALTDFFVHKEHKS